MNTNIKIPRILITGATGQIGGKTITHLLKNKEIQIVAAVRSAEKAKAFNEKGIETVIFDFDIESTHATALEGIDRVLIVTGYTVDMLRQSKSFIDNAKKANVKHIVHLGACGRDDTTVAHWAWHQLVERYIEWSGFSFTHLRPETYMQNLLSYGGTNVINNGTITQYVKAARKSWVSVDDVAQVAAISLSEPEIHSGKTYRMGYDAKSYYEIAELLTTIVEKPFQYVPQSPEVFLKAMIASGAEIAYMSCVSDHFKRYADGTIPGADDVFDNFYQITGKQAATWDSFIKEHRSNFDY